MSFLDYLALSFWKVQRRFDFFWNLSCFMHGIGEHVSFPGLWRNNDHNISAITNSVAINCAAYSLHSIGKWLLEPWCPRLRISGLVLDALTRKSACIWFAARSQSTHLVCCCMLMLLLNCRGGCRWKVCKRNCCEGEAGSLYSWRCNGCYWCQNVSQNQSPRWRRKWKSLAY